jgi:GntR family transcriptional regulator / MocR family aminotransferase
LNILKSLKSIAFNSSTPLRRQLYEELRQAILTGKLRPDRKLPSTRSLAKSLQISRTTVTECYEQLIGEGYLQAIVGSGTFVSSQLPDDLLKSNLDGIEIDRTNRNNLSVQLSSYGANLAKFDIPGKKQLDAPISFRYGSPAFDRFPFQIWRKTKVI